MALSFSNVKLASALVFETARRGYAVVSEGAVSGSVRGAMSNMMLKKGVEEESKTSPWVPDPKTGYYRPESHANEIDAAELRQMLLKHKIRQH